MTLNGVMAVTLRYFTEFGKPALQKTMCGGIYARVYCIFSACTICRRKESSRSLSHLLMSFLYLKLTVPRRLVTYFRYSALYKCTYYYYYYYYQYAQMMGTSISNCAKKVS